MPTIRRNRRRIGELNPEPVQLPGQQSATQFDFGQGGGGAGAAGGGARATSVQAEEQQVGSLEDILQGFGEARERMGERARGVEDAFLQDLRGGREALSSMAQGITAELFAPGGQVEEATSQALRQTTESGFGPRSGGFDQARLNILEGAQEQVANRVAQAAPQIRGQTLQGFGQLAGQLRGATESLRESEFGGRASIEQLEMARQRQRQNEMILQEFLDERGGGIGETIAGGLTGAGSGALAGAGMGSVLGVPGAAAGGIIGGLAGLLG